MNELSKLNKRDIKKLKSNLLNTVDQEIHINLEYTLLLICSTIIATLGLITNSTTIIIGAMIISPLFWPIVGITIGLITTKKHLIKRGAITLLVSLFLILIIGLLISLLVPFSELTDEIYKRANPTLIDIFIALPTSIIGIAAIFYPGISSSSTGVAVSISLLPPLCVAGIALSKGAMNIFFNSLLLFGANFGTIIFAGVITLFLLGVRPTVFKAKNRLKIGLILSSIFLALLSLPLGLYHHQNIKANNLKKKTEKVLRRQFYKLTPNIKIKELHINVKNQNSIKVEATLYTENAKPITMNYKQDIVKLLEQNLNTKVRLELNVIETLVLK